MATAASVSYGFGTALATYNFIRSKRAVDGVTALADAAVLGLSLWMGFRGRRPHLRIVPSDNVRSIPDQGAN